MLKNIFEQFDIEGTGSCPLDIVPAILSTLGVKIKQDELNALIQEIDSDGSGMIEFEEYIELAKRYIEPETDFYRMSAELKEVFMIFDKQSKSNIFRKIIF